MIASAWKFQFDFEGTIFIYHLSLHTGSSNHEVFKSRTDVFQSKCVGGKNSNTCVGLGSVAGFCRSRGIGALGMFVVSVAVGANGVFVTTEGDSVDVVVVAVVGVFAVLSSSLRTA